MKCLRQHSGGPRHCVESLVRFVPEIPEFGVQGVILHIFKSAAVKLIAATLRGDGDISDLGEFGVVVELRDQFHDSSPTRRARASGDGSERKIQSRT